MKAAKKGWTVDQCYDTKKEMTVENSKKAYNILKTLT